MVDRGGGRMVVMGGWWGWGCGVGGLEVIPVIEIITYLRRFFSEQIQCVCTCIPNMFTIFKRRLS